MKMILKMIKQEKNRKKNNITFNRINYPQITNLPHHHPHTPISESEQIRLLNNPKYIESLPKHQMNPSSLEPKIEKKIKMVRIQPKEEEDIYLNNITYPKIEEILSNKDDDHNLSSYGDNVLFSENSNELPPNTENLNENEENLNQEEDDEKIKNRIPHKINNPFQLKREGPKIQVFGAFNTGTNLMVKLLNNIFQTQIPKEGSTRKWKHTLNVKNFPRLFHICMIKNPFSWFQSVIKESYLIEWDKKKKLLHQPVLMRGEGNPQRFSSISKLWLHYYITYLEFSKNHKYNVLVIPFEEMIYDTDNLYHFLSDVFKIPLPMNYKDIKEKTMARPAKPHGHCHTLNQVKEKTKLEFLFSKYSKEDVVKFLPRCTHSSHLT